MKEYQFPIINIQYQLRISRNSWQVENMKGKDQDEKKQNNLSKYNAYKIGQRKKPLKRHFI